MRPCIGIPISFSWLIFGNSTLFQYHEIKQLSNRLWKNWRIFRLVFLLLRSLWFSAIVRRFREDGTSALPSEPTTEKWSSKKPLKGHGKKPWRSADFLFIMASTVLFVIPSFGVETPATTFCHFPNSEQRAEKSQFMWLSCSFLKWLTSFLSLHLRSRQWQKMYRVSQQVQEIDFWRENCYIEIHNVH